MADVHLCFIRQCTQHVCERMMQLSRRPFEESPTPSAKQCVSGKTDFSQIITNSTLRVTRCMQRPDGKLAHRQLLLMFYAVGHARDAVPLTLVTVDRDRVDSAY